MAGFWDSSSIVPLTIDQPATPGLRRVLAEDAGVVVWWGSPVEVRSALARLTREGLLTGSGAPRDAFPRSGAYGGNFQLAAALL